MQHTLRPGAGSGRVLCALLTWHGTAWVVRAGARSRDFTDALRNYEEQGHTVGGVLRWLWRSLNPLPPAGMRHNALPATGILVRCLAVRRKGACSWLHLQLYCYISPCTPPLDLAYHINACAGPQPADCSEDSKGSRTDRARVEPRRQQRWGGGGDERAGRAGGVRPAGAAEHPAAHPGGGCRHAWCRGEGWVQAKSGVALLGACPACADRQPAAGLRGDKCKCTPR